MRRLATSLLCLIGVLGCDRREESVLLEVSAVEPAQWAPGQPVRVHGNGFPGGRDARLRLEGVMHRPGAEPSEVAVELAGRATASDRIEARFTEDALGALGGRGTLHGRVIALFDTADGRGRVIGRSDELELDLGTGVTRRMREEIARRRAGAATAERVGLLLAEEGSDARGLPIAGVRDGSPAARAGLLTGDRVLSAEGVHAHDLSDLLPAPGRDTITLRLARRGEAAPFEVLLPVEAAASSAVRPETVRATVIALGWLLLFAALFAPTAGVADWIAGGMRRDAPPPPGGLRARWLRHRREVPIVALAAVAAAAVPAIDRVWPLHAKLEVLVLGALALRLGIAWLASPGLAARARAGAILRALRSAAFLGIGLGAIAVLGGTTEIGALSRQPGDPLSWAILRWPVAVPALALISIGGVWRAHGGSAVARAIDDVVLLAVAATTVALLFGGWGTGEGQGALRLVRGAGFAVATLAYWLWLRRARERRPAAGLAWVGAAISVVVVVGVTLLVALEPPEVLTAAIARVLGGAAGIVLLAAAARLVAAPRARPSPLHRFA